MMQGDGHHGTMQAANIWWNDRLVDADTPVLAAGDAGAQWGMGVFETMRAENGHVPLIERHHVRLEEGADRLGIELPMREEREAAIAVLLEKNGLAGGSARVRLSVTAGRRGLREPEAEPTWLIQACPLGAVPGAAVVGLSPWVRNERSPLAGIKVLCYSENILALDWARANDFDELVWLDSQGRISEATTANVFLVHNGVVSTPGIAAGCLPGVTRGVLLERAQEKGIEVREAELYAGVMEDHDEMFLTSAVFGVRPVKSWNGRALPGAEGPVTRAMAEVFAESLYR